MSKRYNYFGYGYILIVYMYIGETSDRFFVILGGAVNIFLPKDAISLENDKKSRKEYFSKK